eukprot:526474-Prorocentrum_minimum.AAC.1
MTGLSIQHYILLFSRNGFVYSHSADPGAGRGGAGQWGCCTSPGTPVPVSYTHLRAHETLMNL